MTDFKHRYRLHVKSKNNNEKEKQKKVERMALAETMNFMEDYLQSCDNEVASYIQLSPVRKFYSSVLQKVNAALM